MAACYSELYEEGEVEISTYPTHLKPLYISYWFFSHIYLQASKKAGVLCMTLYLYTDGQLFFVSCTHVCILLFSNLLSVVGKIAITC